MGKKVKLVISILLLLLSVAYTFLVMKYDVQPIGANGSKVGFAKINQIFLDKFAYDNLYYLITELIGKLVLGVAGIFGLVGFIQLVKRKSLKKVDKEIYALGGLYVITIGLYVLFEKVVINYRPIILPNEIELESSYPSSHTLLACVILGSCIFVLDHFLKNKQMKRTLQLICWLLMAAMIVGRIMSGVHWISDIVGGVLISMTLVSFFCTIISKKKKQEKEEIEYSKEDLLVFETFGQKVPENALIKDEENDETYVIKDKKDNNSEKMIYRNDDKKDNSVVEEKPFSQIIAEKAKEQSSKNNFADKTLSEIISENNFSNVEKYDNETNDSFYQQQDDLKEFVNEFNRTHQLQQEENEESVLNQKAQFETEIAENVFVSEINPNILLEDNLNQNEGEAEGMEKEIIATENTSIQTAVMPQQEILEDNYQQEDYEEIEKINIFDVETVFEEDEVEFVQIKPSKEEFVLDIKEIDE